MTLIFQRINFVRDVMERTCSVLDISCFDNLWWNCRQLYFLFQPRGGDGRKWWGSIHRIIPEPGVHGGHREILRQPDVDPLQDGGGWWAGGLWVDIRVQQLSLRTERGEHVVQWQHLSALWLHHVQEQITSRVKSQSEQNWMFYYLSHRIPFPFIHYYEKPFVWISIW